MVTVHSKGFGSTKDGAKVKAFDLCNGNGMTVTVLDYGATVQRIVVPDRNGKAVDVSLGYDDITSYENGACFYGAFVGRYANRIANARFTLDGREYLLEKTPGESNHLHGVFTKRIFETVPGDGTLALRYRSPDMEEGFPGNVETEIVYRLTEDSALEIAYRATTDAPTVLNLTNHTYFNLNGQDGSTVLDHLLRLNSGFFTEYDGSYAQTGNILPVDGTPLDFRTGHSIGSLFGGDCPQFRLCAGYDHNMILNGKAGDLRPIGEAGSEKSGIRLEAFTTEPAVQFYTGNYMHLDPVPYGKSGVRYPKYGGFCLEAQHYPDSVNHPNFPSTVLRPGEVYRQKTVYRFSVF